MAEPGEIIELTGSTEFTTADPQIQLRFVERKVPIGGELRSIRILQQAWAITTYRAINFLPQAVALHTEWRDVPLVTEE